MEVFITVHYVNGWFVGYLRMLYEQHGVT